MKGNFQDAIWPATQIAALFGFALIEYPIGKPRRLISLVYAILPMMLHIFLYLCRQFFFIHDNPIFQRSVSDYAMEFCSIISFTCVCFTQWHGERYCRCLDGINEVDNALMGLGLEKDYSKLRKAMVVTIVAWISWSLILEFMDMSFFLNLPDTDSKYIAFTLFVLDMPINLPIVVDIVFSLLLGYAGTRFDCINNFLREFVPDENDSVGWFRGNATTSIHKVLVLDERNTRIIWTMMCVNKYGFRHLHFRLMEVTRDINRALQMQISLFGLVAYVYILISVIFTFRTILVPYDGDKLQMVVVIWLWTVAFFLKIVITNHVCETVSGKATRISDTAIKLLHTIDNEILREDVSLIILQAKHKPLRFSSLGLTYFGYQLMNDIFASMVTVTVIILQMKTGLN